VGLCLFEINPKYTPLEGRLMWTVYKRREGDSRVEFIGE
jgi:hypothetical protein